ncbi:MAG: hypothetical protein XXXJIFNMEKO3_02548 [Candidatus Erwinia impunctatus]
MDKSLATADMTQETKQIQQLADKVMAEIETLFAAKAIVPSSLQWQMLLSHIRGMASRAITAEPLPEVEAELFEEISKESMALAQQVVDLFGNLPKEETWLLSVHFEVARENG